jgi:hypothetical protein
VQIFLIAFQHPIEIAIAVGVVGIMVYVFARSAQTAENRPPSFATVLAGVNGKILMGGVFVLWAIAFAVLLQLVPQEGASSPYGALGLIAMFTGFFAMMGVLWAVIRD